MNRKVPVRTQPDLTEWLHEHGRGPTVIPNVPKEMLSLAATYHDADVLEPVEDKAREVHQLMSDLEIAVAWQVLGDPAETVFYHPEEKQFYRYPTVP